LLNAHRNLLKIIASALRQTFDAKGYADSVLERTLKGDSRLGSRDRRFIASHFYDMVRYWRQVLWIEEKATGANAKDHFTRVLLWVQKGGEYGLSHIPEAENLPKKEEIEQWLLEPLPRAIAQSYPEWLDHWAMEELPERWPLECEALNVVAPTYLRVNSLRATAQEVKEVLAMEGVEVSLVEGHPYALLMATRENVIRLGSFRKGLYEVQDASSQLIAPFLEVESGMSVIDACAGAGGKTLHLAAMMEDEGNITAMDIEGWKLGELQKRARRAGVSIIETQQIRTPKDIKNMYQSADRLLLDAPCTGMGVLRRNPDAKWKLTAEHTEWVRNTQLEILEDYSMMLKPGGKMVYATCSIMPSENEKQVEKFLSNNPEYQLEAMHHTWPSEGWDGFFMARMKKG